MSNNISKHNHLKWILPILVLVLAGVVTLVMVKSRKITSKKAPTNPGLLVETIKVVRQNEHAIVYATGTVEPQREIALVVEVSGKLSWVSPRFVAGGFFRKGECLLKIDPRDYQLAVQKAQADLARAQTGLQTEEGQSSIARREWERLALPDKGAPSPLVLRQPQLESAKANLTAAQAGLELAQLSLERTRICAPFNGRLRSKKVDLGEYVRSGNSLAIFAGTDQAEIVVPLPVADLRWLKIPVAGSGQPGSSCRVSTLIEGQHYQWWGDISRAFGEIDNASRMAKIAIRVEDPYNLKPKKTAGKIPLENGLFVDVEIKGTALAQVASIPRSALREGDVVWLADGKDQLEIRPVHILRRQQQTLLIDRGLRGGERLILTSISGVAPGMKLRPQHREDQL